MGRTVLIAALVVAVCLASAGFGYVLGGQHRQVKFDAYKLKAEAFTSEQLEVAKATSREVAKAQQAGKDLIEACEQRIANETARADAAEARINKLMRRGAGMTPQFPLNPGELD